MTRTANPTATTLFVTITLADAEHWPALSRAAGRLGAVAAVLQGEGPALVDQLDALADARFCEVTLVGVTLGAGGVPASWIGHVARWWLAQRDRTMRLKFVVRALRALPTSLPDGASAQVLRPEASGLANPTWDDPPPVSSHVLVCRGPRCAAKGAEQLIDSLGAELHARGLLDTDVLVTQTGCLYPCNRAPVVCVQPDMAWHGPVEPADVAAFVDRLCPRQDSRPRWTTDRM